MDTEALWTEIQRMVSRTLNAIHPEVALAYSTCFQKSEVIADLVDRWAFHPQPDTSMNKSHSGRMLTNIPMLICCVSCVPSASMCPHDPTLVDRGTLIDGGW